MSNPSLAPASTPSLRQKTVGGILWLAVQNLSTRGISLLQQLALAWLLAKSDFGLIGLAYTVSTFAALLSNPGIDAILVQRGRRFDRWVTPAFWLGMTTGMAAMVLMAVAAPVAAWAYREPQLVGLILVLSLGAPLQTLQIVPRAHLQTHLRFRGLVLLNLSNVALMAALTVLCAYLGFGPYSFAIPVPITAALVSAMAWSTARPTVGLHPHVRRWRYLIGDSAALLGTRIMNIAVSQGDYIALGLFGVSQAAIGTYFFAYRFSTQAFWLTANSVPAVLFPSLSRLVENPEGQVRATRRAVRLLAVVAIPICMLQVLLANPLFRLLFPDRWLDAVLPLQVLSLGIMFNAPAWPVTSLLMAQRRFRELFRIAVVYTVVFAVMVTVALTVDESILAVALAVSLWYCWSSAYAYRAAIPRESFYSFFLQCYRPALAAILAALPSALLLAAMPSGRLADALLVVAITLIFVLTYALLLRQIAPSDWADFWAQLTPFWKRLPWQRMAPLEGVKSETRP